MWFKGLCNAPILQLQGGKKGLILQFMCCVISEEDNAISRYQPVVMLYGSECNKHGTDFSRVQLQLNKISALISPACLANSWLRSGKGYQTASTPLCTPSMHSCGNKSQLQSLHTSAARSSVNTPARVHGSSQGSERVSRHQPPCGWCSSVIRHLWQRDLEEHTSTFSHKDITPLGQMEWHVESMHMFLSEGSREAFGALRNVSVLPIRCSNTARSPSQQKAKVFYHRSAFKFI